MKETVNANIGSLAFTLDEDAYRKLKAYLEAVGRHLPADDADTLGDIERRIAELFREKIASPARVISIVEVEEAIAQLGAPEEFGAETRAGAHGEKTADETAAPQTEPARRLYRSRTNRSIAGVCGGLAEFLGTDVTLLRLLTLFLILFGGLSIWVYIILWIVIPEAPTRHFKID